MSSSATPASPPGTLYGVGVGPGAPDLITLRAVNVLKHADVILAAASPRNNHSLALSIAAPHLPPDTPVQRLDFPMTRDQSVLDAAWKQNTETIAAILRAGRNAVFLTLGDPLIYSTFGYMLTCLQKLDPTLPIEVVSGITSYQAAAAATRTVLCESGENLLLLPGINTGEELQQCLETADNAVILKTYKNSRAIYTALEATGRGEAMVFASQLGLPGEVICRGVKQAPEQPHYLSLVLSPAKDKKSKKSNN